ncbi:MAG: class I SAM-dependent methyltransferase [Roseburia sp.]|nr:class I SAM-dependent methyltransferase [Anaeroplasma bactoclasticum]MCM1196948.1 class I SAM-dependent methyltransferase [Roseburia sp.]MCM1557444.1 class I SAM-dependent methyltransferase [Anaeroplasma bactoclasticum]
MNDFYSLHSKGYINATECCDMSIQYNLFEQHLNKNARCILDLGFGSGRDSLYFQLKYEVFGTDVTEEFCQHAKRIGLKNIYHMKAQDLNFVNQFDGIWACASLLHIPSNELPDVFKRCHKALKEDGVVYCSFKYGDFEGIRNERYFTDMNFEKLKKLIDPTQFEIVKECITLDVRPERNEQWFNVILKKII